MGKRFYKAKCQVRNPLGERTRARVSDEYIMSNGEVRGGCSGWLDPMYDEIIDICKSCADYVMNVAEEEML